MEMCIVEEAEKLKEKNNVLVVNPKKVSIESIRLAEKLAKNSFRERKNIASSFCMEFALWLSGKTNISSALAYLSPEKGAKALLIDFNFKANRLPKGLRKNATWEEIEKISLSRI